MGVEQRACVGLSWGSDDLRGRAKLDQLAVAEDGDALASSAASAMSWLMNSSVMPSSATSRRIRATISACTMVSSALVASSAISNFGPAAIAAAIATRCF